MATKVGDIFVALGFESKNLPGFKDGIRNVRDEVFKLTAVVTAAGYALNRFAVNAQQFKNFTLTTGLLASNLQKFQIAGQLSNISLSAEEVTSSIQSLQSNLTQIRLGGGNLRPFQLLGIDTRGGDAFKVLDQLRDRIKGLDPSIATNLLQEMGLSPNFISLLKLTREEFQKLSGTGIRSEDTIASLVRVGQEIKKLTIAMGAARDEMIASFEPAIMSIIAFIRRMGNHINVLIDAFKKLEHESPGIAAAIKAAFGGLAVALALAFAPLTATIVGLLLIFDDFMVFMKGGKSVIGLFVNALKSAFSSLEGSLDFLEPIVFVLDKLLAVAQYFPAVKIALASLRHLSGMKDGKGEGATQGALNNLIQGAGIALPGVSSGNNVVFNNNFTISSGADPVAVANSIDNKLQKQMNYSINDFNNGAKY